MNALAREKSPYLLQHAGNPVDWFPWGEAAFARARAEQKPIFLSIGYSTCHWCHVMAHESFEDPAIAALLNEHFVAIKVDREERPDVDRVYMAYVQALTGHGGWPLSAWLTPELKPFYGGTYFPPEDQPGRAGFPALLRAIAAGWANEREKLQAESERVLETLRAHHGGNTPPEGADLAAAGGAAFEKAFQYFHGAFDAANGGFGGAPKFPRAASLNFLFRCAARPGAGVGGAAVSMAGVTLQKMAQGGLHDHVGGGFHRYSVDAQWFVPHFEKMLYDQAQIALNSLEARLATGDERYAWLARDIFDYVARELTSPDGAFYSAEDADSAPAPAAGVESAGAGRHVEGAFYVWTHAEIARVLGVEAPFFCAHFGVMENGNVPAHRDPHGEFSGKNIIAQVRPLAETARLAGLTEQAASDRLGAALIQLRAVRAGRPRPQRDDKVITAWNGLMISAFARGAQILGGDKAERERLLAPALRAGEFLQRELYDSSRGVLYRSYREGRSAVEGFAEDYAFLIQGLLDLYEASFELRWLQWAERLQEMMDNRFWDGPRGGYFNSAAGDASIVLRLKEDYDGAEPAPSSVAAMNLLRLGAIFDGGEALTEAAAPGAAASRRSGVSYRERGRRTVEAFQAQWSGAPPTLPQMLCALELALDAPRHVVLAGDPAADDFRALASVLHEKLGPRRTLLGVSGNEGRAWLAARAPWLEAMRPIQGRATAYVCEEFACQAPVTKPAELRDLLRR